MTQKELEAKKEIEDKFASIADGFDLLTVSCLKVVGMHDAAEEYMKRVVEGKGNPLSFSSSPHGAGRVYSRSAARKLFTIEQLRESMKGIEYRETDAFLDEIPQAYKDIDQVMEDAKDLVEIQHTLHQIVNVKGD